MPVMIEPDEHPAVWSSKDGGHNGEGLLLQACLPNLPYWQDMKESLMLVSGAVAVLKEKS